MEPASVVVVRCRRPSSVEPPWEGGTKVCINGPGHLTKMAAMPIYGKNLKKSSSPELAGRFP